MRQHMRYYVRIIVQGITANIKASIRVNNLYVLETLTQKGRHDKLQRIRMRNLVVIYSRVDSLLWRVCTHSHFNSRCKIYTLDSDHHVSVEGHHLWTHINNVRPEQVVVDYRHKGISPFIVCIPALYEVIRSITQN